MPPFEHSGGANENRPAKPAHLQESKRATNKRTECCEHLQVFDYVSSPHGNGIVIRVLPEKIGIILDATNEVEYFEISGTQELLTIPDSW